MPVDTNRNSFAAGSLPPALSAEIIQKLQESSAVMRLARKIDLPGAGATIPVITSDPVAEWVAESENKPVSNPEITTKLMSAYTLAVIEPFSNQFLRDASGLYAELVKRLPAALGFRFDQTVIGAVQSPGTNFDQFTVSGTTCQQINAANTTTYAALVAADTDIATHGGVLNGFAISPVGRGILLAAVDDVKRPIFINSVAEGAIPQILGAPTYTAKGVYDATNHVVGIAGDWSQAIYGTVNDVQISVSDQATLTSGNTTINLWQRNMFAVRAEIEVGFRADVSCFNLLTNG